MQCARSFVRTLRLLLIVVKLDPLYFIAQTHAQQRSSCNRAKPGATTRSNCTPAAAAAAAAAANTNEAQRTLCCRSRLYVRRKRRGSAVITSASRTNRNRQRGSFRRNHAEVSLVGCIDSWCHSHTHRIPDRPPPQSAVR